MNIQSVLTRMSENMHLYHYQNQVSCKEKEANREDN